MSLATIRYYIIRFLNVKYIYKSILYRKGECKKCGFCCRGCKYYQDNKCIVYCDRIVYEPRCCPFPIDETDKNMVNKNCGYWWKK